jgi:Fic family protein
MKLPDKQIDWKKVLDEEGENIFRLVSDKAVLEKIAEYNKKYLYWDDLRYRVKNETEQKYFWAFMKFLRSTKYETIPFDSIKMKYVSLPEINRKLHQFDKFLAGTIEIQTKTLGLEKRYVISSLMEEAIASSLLEGAATTRKAAKEMLKQKRKPKTRDEKMIVNGYDTMQMIVKRQKEKLSPEYLLEIQTLITKDTLERGEDVGIFRDNNDIVVGDPQNPQIVYHTPPDYAEVPKLIKELCDFANNDDGDFIHPVVKGIILHFLIGYIHPFNDGNGRTARSVFYWYVLSRGYWLFEYMAVSRRILRSRKDYTIAYLHSEYDEMDITYFIKYISTCIEDALNDLMAYIKQKQIEQHETKSILAEIKDLNFRQVSILEETMKNPEKYFSIQEISETYHVVYQTARSDLLYLEKKGYLKMRKISRKFVFRLDEKFKEKISTTK